MRTILNVEYSGIWASYWGYYTIVSSFCSVYFLAKGFDNTDIGLMFALASIVGVVIQPPLANLADNSRVLHLHRLLQILGAVLLGLTGLLFVFSSKGLALFAVYLIMTAIHLAMQGLINSLNFRLQETGYSVNYGICRAVGSIGCAVATLALGFLVDRHGADTIPVFGVAMILLFLAFMVINDLRYVVEMRRHVAYGRNEVPSAGGHLDAEDHQIGLIDFLKGNKMFLLMSTGVIFLFFGNSATTNFIYQIVTDVGGTSAQMGTASSVMIFFEVPPLLLFSLLLRRWRALTLLRVAAVGMTVKLSLYWLAPSIGVIYCATATQMVAFALFLPAMVQFVDEVMEKGEAVKGQAWFTMCTTIGAVFSNFFGGILIDASGAKLLLFVSVLLSLAGTLIIVTLAGKVPRKK